MALLRVVSCSLVLACVVLVSLPARADRTLAAVWPFELNGGVSAPMGPGRGPVLGVIGFPMPIPLPIFEQDFNHNDARQRAPGVRLMLMPELVLGKQHDPSVDETADATFQFRYGARFSGPVVGTLDVLAGLGSTLDAWPEVRSSLSPELGLRVRARRCFYGSAEVTSCSFRYMTLVARGEFDGSPERPALVVLLGFSSF